MLIQSPVEMRPGEESTEDVAMLCRFCVSSNQKLPLPVVTGNNNKQLSSAPYRPTCISQGETKLLLQNILINWVKLQSWNKAD